MKFLKTIFTPAAMAIMSVGSVNARIGDDSNQRELSESGKEPTNFMTWWDDKGDYKSKSSCLHNPYNLTPTMTKSHHYCAVSADIFNDGGKGAACGDCYEISYDGKGKSVYWDGVPEGARAGSAKIQVINSGAGKKGKHFDCLLGAFSQITGLITDGMPITYKKIACP